MGLPQISTMAPSAESSKYGTIGEEDGVLDRISSTMNLQRHVAFAVNYEVAMVHQFLASKVVKRRSSSQTISLVAPPDHVDSLRDATTPNSPRGVCHTAVLFSDNGGGPKKENNAPNVSPLPEEQPLRTALDASDVNTPTNTSSNNNNNNALVVNNNNNSGAPPAAAGTTTTTSPMQHNNNNKRRSAREKKKDVTLSRIRVRYDMQLVPAVHRNRAFLQSHPVWWRMTNSAATTESILPTQPPEEDAPTRRSSRLTTSTERDATADPSTQSKEQPAISSSSCKYCTTNFASHDAIPPAPATTSTDSFEPFALDETVVWIPSKRSEWEDSVSEMTAVCASAAHRRYLQHLPLDSSNSPSNQKPFHAPLSREYIRDRVDIDDPLKGFQLRHKSGGWLQGFILWTTFTTWTHDFQWNSQHPASGFATATAEAVEPTSSSSPPVAVLATGTAVDADGRLAAQLESQERSGNPHENGIVFPSIAEIALVGGLGCGEYLLRLALDDIQAAGTYRYVVLQATDQSKSFYEKYGFVRVGAVCRYRLSGSGGGLDTLPEEEEPMEGYRHWTHANESEQSLQQHGGPSYMMCLPLPPRPNVSEVHHASSCSTCGGGAMRRPSFMDRLLSLAVDVKPTIEPLGNSLTPGPKPLRRNSSLHASSESVPRTPVLLGGAAAVVKKPPPTTSRRGSIPPRVVTEKRKSITSAVVSKRPSDSEVVIQEPTVKRRKLHKSPTPTITREQLLNPPPSGGSLTYAQKQYQSVWLAVPPTPVEAASATRRPPPKSRRLQQQHRPRRAPSTVVTTERSRRSVVHREQPLRPVGLPPLPFPVPARSSSSTPKKSFAKDAASNAALSPSSSSEKVELLKKPGAKPTRIHKGELMKQKVKSYPRSRLHYYNRVVKRKGNGVGSGDGIPEYYFVLQYCETTNALRLAPMAARGQLTGKREGRPRFQVVLEETDANFCTVAASDYEVVPATMVMKTPVVANEAWDVECD